MENKEQQSKEGVTVNLFLNRLQERVSLYNAKLLLRTVMLETGIDCESNSELTDDLAKQICLTLIKKGGPSFQVGQSVYKEYLQ